MSDEKRLAPAAFVGAVAHAYNSAASGWSS